MNTLSPQEVEKLKFPIGNFVLPENSNQDHLTSWRNDIADFPFIITNLTDPLTDEQLAYTYRPNGWNIRQVVHHCADSHINAYVRFKLALTEDKPIIKPYNEAQWAQLSDYNEDIAVSLTLIQALHKKWIVIIDSMEEQELDKEFTHPESGHSSPLKFWIGKYAWHGRHHVAHIKQALQNKSRL